MNKNKRLIQRLQIFTVLSLGLAGCSSTPKTELPANANPNDEVTRMNRDIADGDTNDFAVLDQKDFNESKEHLRKAQDELKDNASQQDVLEEVAIARGFYDRAEKLSMERKSKVETILDSRSQAVSAGALQYPQSRKELDAVDDDARKLAESSDEPKSDDVMKLQQRYGAVELDALTTQQLGDAKATIDAAKDQDATSKAPKTYNRAKIDYDNAKNAISMNRSSRADYIAAVKQANLSADTLGKVMEMAKKNDKDFNEDEAVRIVWQERKIHSLDDAVTDQQAQQSKLQAQKAELQDKVATDQASLNESNKKVAMQKALTEAQHEFTAQEAEVYQKDNQLLIRLKAVGFDSGSYKIPSRSLDLLAKAQSVVQGLKPESVVIEGHTDSVGTEAKNEKLSQERADAVAKYFENNGVDANKIKAEGYGDSKPLATNKTKEGRAENRRIDILVTPSGDL